jgi:outer membrane lipopolysaccharide assembly protein LptE/RlpB
MSFKKFPHPLLALLIILIASLALGSCSAEYHLRKAVKKGANVWQTKWDTTIVTKERNLWDTLTLNNVDTVVVQKDNIRIKLVRNFDTIRLQATCLPDTVQVTKYINTKITTRAKGNW